MNARAIVTTPAGVALAVVVALFALGAVIIALAPQRRARPGGASGLWHAYASTLVIVAAVLIPAAIHPALFTLVAIVAAYRCALELAALHRHRLDVLARAAIAAVLVGGAVLAVVQDARATSILMACTAAVVLAMAPLYARAIARPPPVRVWVLTAAFPVVAAAQLAYLIHRPNGFLWLFFLYVTVETQDSMAFLFGRVLGRRALLPRLSPHKTIEGAVAGACFGIGIGTAIAAFVLDQSAAVALALAVLVVAGGFAGDVFASALKRAAGVKDFPPVHALHGGVMDIYDSTLFAAVPLGVALWATTI